MMPLLAVMAAMASCTEKINDKDTPKVEDRSFTFTARTAHDAEKELTTVTLLLEKGARDASYLLEYTVPGQEDLVIRDMTGEDVASGSAISTDSEGRCVFQIMDRDLPKGDHVLSMTFRTDLWEQQLDVPFTTEYQPYDIRYSLSTAAGDGTELLLELLRGDRDAVYRIGCEVAGQYGYKESWDISFKDSDRVTITLPLIRPGDYELNVTTDDGHGTRSFKEKYTEILRERYATLRISATEYPQGHYSLHLSANPYRIGIDFQSELTMEGYCDYDDVQSDRDGDWPWPRTAYSEESHVSDPLKGIYSNEYIQLHDRMALDEAIRDHTEQHCHFSQCEGDYGYPSSCLTGYSYPHHTPYKEYLSMSLKVTDLAEGVKVTFMHDITPMLSNSGVLLNGQLLEPGRTIEIMGSTDEQ